jgi:hypothetical protein
MTNDEIAAIADRTLRPLLGPLGMERLEVEAKDDQSGTPALYISVFFRKGSKAPKGELQMKALVEIGRALEAAGEQRFPYVDHRFWHEEFEPEDDDAEESPSVR